MQIVGRIWLNLVTWTCGSWSGGQHDLYFTVQWFCLISWILFDVCTSYFRSMNQYDPTFDLNIDVGQCALFSWSSDYTLKTISCMNIIIWDYESVWPDAWPQNKCRSLWPIVHSPVILPYILKTIWCMYIILSEYESIQLDVWPQNKCRSLWLIFHGPVIVPYTLEDYFMYEHHYLGLWISMTWCMTSK